MKALHDWFRKYPVVCILLLLAACVHYEENTATSSSSFPGMFNGLAVLSVVGIVLVFRIFNAIESLSLAKGWLGSKPTYRYDILIPIGIVAAAFKWRSAGPMIMGMDGKPAYQWEFTWSDSTLNGYFVLALIAVVFLQRVVVLIRAIESTSRRALDVPHGHEES